MPWFSRLSCLRSWSKSVTQRRLISQRKRGKPGGDLLLNANPAALSKVVGLNGKSTGEITSGQATSVDHGFTVISPQENPSPRMETAASTPNSCSRGHS